MPLLFIVKLLLAQLEPSITTTNEPVVGEAGKVSVNAPPEVSAMYDVLIVAVVAEVILT